MTKESEAPRGRSGRGGTRRRRGTTAAESSRVPANDDGPPGRSRIDAVVRRNLLLFDGEALKRIHESCYVLAERAAELPLDELLAHLDAFEATGGFPLEKHQWAFCRSVQESLRSIVMPLREAAAAYKRAEEYWDEQIAAGHVP
jgi:hypothetical protein